MDGICFLFQIPAWFPGVYYPEGQLPHIAGGSPEGDPADNGTGYRGTRCCTIGPTEVARPTEVERPPKCSWNAATNTASQHLCEGPG